MPENRELAFALIDLSILCGDRFRIFVESFTEPEGTGTEEANVKSQLTPEIESNIGFKWLNKQQGIIDAMDLFIADARDPDLPARAIQARQLLFYECVALGAGKSMLDWEPQMFSAEDKRRAASHAEELARYIARGIWKHPFSQHAGQITAALLHIKNDLAASRRSYGGQTAKQKAILTRMARDFWETGTRKQEQIVELLELIAGALGFDASHRTLQRYVNEALFPKLTSEPMPKDNFRREYLRILSR